MAIDVARLDDAPVAIVTIDHPPVNSLDVTTTVELTGAFASFAHDPDVSAVVLTATGTRAFCAGIDLREPAERRGGPGADRGQPALVVDAGVLVRDLFWSVFDCPVPVIGAVNGPAIGAGLALASLCDVLVASRDASMAATEINVGRLGAYAFLARMVGPYQARKLYFTGDPISAEELHAIGAVARLTTPEQLLTIALELARDIAAKSPIALRLAKEAMNRVEDLPLRDAYRLEQDYTIRLRGYDDAGEAARAAAEGRAPEWHWR